MQLFSFRSSNQCCSLKKGAFRNFTKLTGKHLWKTFFFKKETLAQVFFCEFCETSKKTLFTEHLWTTASVHFAVLEGEGLSEQLNILKLGQVKKGGALTLLTLLRIAEKVPNPLPTSFFPVTFRKVGISPQNILTFWFSYFTKKKTVKISL